MLGVSGCLIFTRDTMLQRLPGHGPTRMPYLAHTPPRRPAAPPPRFAGGSEPLFRRAGMYRRNAAGAALRGLGGGYIVTQTDTGAPLRGFGGGGRACAAAAPLSLRACVQRSRAAKGPQSRAHGPARPPAGPSIRARPPAGWAQ